MAIIALPACKVSSFKWTLLRNDIESRSVFGTQSLEGSLPLWTVAMTGTPQKRDEAIAFETFLESLAGFRNQLALHHRARPVPAGTVRGVLTLASAAAMGATSLTLIGGATQAGKTLLPGDLLGLGAGLTQQVLRVAAFAAADAGGGVSVAVATPLRNAFPAGTAVVWNQPKALFRQRKNNAGIEYVPGIIGQPWSLDLIEDWRP